MSHGQTPQQADAERHEQNRGLVVVALLAILTVLEFVVAIVIDSTEGLIAGLTPFALVKAGMIVWYFMHVYRVWRGEEDHS